MSDREEMQPATCGWWVGPIWKLNGETCVCREAPNHPMPHRCTCGSWFEGTGRPREVLTHD